MSEIETPSYFLCPITLDIMKDPVTTTTGITYDRSSIEHWIFSLKNNTCPTTNQTLLQELTPNTTLRRLIQSWTGLHAAHRLPTPKPPATAAHLQTLLKNPNLNLQTLETLKTLASENLTNRRLVETSSAPAVVSAAVIKRAMVLSLSSQEDFFCKEALTFLNSLNLSEKTLKTLASSEFIDALTTIMKLGSNDSRAHSAMLLKKITEFSDPLILTGLKPGFFAELGQILRGNFSPKATKAAVRVFINTGPWGRNRVKLVEGGAVPILIDLLLDSAKRRVAEITLTALDLVCQCAEGRAELLKHEAGLAIVSKKIFRVSQGGSERAVRILHSISRFSATKGVLKEMLEIGVVAKLCLVVQVDCGVKMKERANEILKMHAMQWRNSSCIPSNLVSSYPSSN